MAIISIAIDNLANLDSLSTRERATRVYGLLRKILNVPVELRTETLSGLMRAIGRTLAAIPSAQRFAISGRIILMFGSSPKQDCPMKLSSSESC